MALSHVLQNWSFYHDCILVCMGSVSLPRGSEGWSVIVIVAFPATRSCFYVKKALKIFLYLKQQGP